MYKYLATENKILHIKFSKQNSSARSFVIYSFSFYVSGHPSDYSNNLSNSILAALLRSLVRLLARFIHSFLCSNRILLKRVLALAIVYAYEDGKNLYNAVKNISRNESFPYVMCTILENNVYLFQHFSIEQTYIYLNLNPLYTA